MTGGPAELDTKAPAAEPDLTAFDRQAASLDRRQADLEKRQRATIKERVDALQRIERLDLRAAQTKVFEEQDQLRQLEARIAEARAILARAREIAVERGLDYETAIGAAKVEHLAEQEHGYRTPSRLRR